MIDGLPADAGYGIHAVIQRYRGRNGDVLCRRSVIRKAGEGDGARSRPIQHNARDFKFIYIAGIFTDPGELPYIVRQRGMRFLREQEKAERHQKHADCQTQGPFHAEPVLSEKYG